MGICKSIPTNTLTIPTILFLSIRTILMSMGILMGAATPVKEMRKRNNAAQPLNPRPSKSLKVMLAL